VNFAGTERFAIRRLLGAGGMGVVYEALDSHLGSVVALKTLERAQGDALLRFKTEFRALQHLDHQNLVNLGELMEHDGTWFFTMELVRGVDFLTYVCGSESGWSTHASSIETQPGRRRLGPVPATGSSRDRAAPGGSPRPAFEETRLRDGLAQLTRGLRALHEADKVHRDVKPSNIMVNREGKLVLLDFGLIAERGRDDADASEHVVGTAAYMAPEQAAGMPAEPASDLYAVGVMLYQVLTGHLPFAGSAREVLQEKQTHEPPPPSEVAAEVPADLDELCVALLCVAPEQRPTVEQILNRLSHESQEGSLGFPTTHTAIGWALVGRDSELRQLDDAREQARQGAALAVLVHGQSGVGKTALIQELVSRARTASGDGVVLFRGQCYERESVPFKGFDGVMDSVARYLSSVPNTDAEALVPPDAQILVQVFPVLSRVDAIARAPRLAAVLDPVSARARVFNALRELLGRMAAQRSVIVTIDDMQWADADSRLLLQELLAAPAPPLLVLMSAREMLDLLPDSAEPMRVIELEPLSSAPALELASALLEQAGVSDATEAEAIAKETAGHPLYISELARYAATGIGPRGGLRLHDAIRLRASHLAVDAQRVLEVVSVGAGPMPLAAVREAAELQASSFARHLSTLRVGNMVRCTGAAGAQTVEPYHDRVRDSIASEIPKDIARTHHERLGAALIGADGARLHPELLLHHLEASGQSLRAAQYAGEASQRAVESLAFLRAAELLRTAIRLGDHEPDELRSLHRRLAEALRLSGHGFDAAECYLRAADGADPTSSLECHAFAARLLVTTGHLDLGMKTMGDVLDEFGLAMPRSTLGAIATIVWNRCKLAVRGRGWVSRDTSTIPKADIVRLDALRAISDCMGPLNPVMATALQQQHLLLALRVGEPARAVRAIATEATILASQSIQGVEQARTLMAETSRYATEVGNAKDLPMQSVHHGLNSYLAAEFEKSDEQLEAAERTCRESANHDPLEVSTIWLTWFGALRELGAFSKWRRLYPVFLRDAIQRKDLLAETSLRRVCVFLTLASGHPEAARADLARSSWPTPTGDFHMQHWFELQARAEVAMYDGSAAEATGLLAEFERLQKSMLYYVRPLRYSANWIWARFWLSLARHAAHRQRALKKAIQLAGRLRRDRSPLADVWATLIDASVAASTGNKRRAVSMLERAERGADALSLGLYAAAARWRRAAFVGGATGEALRAQSIAWQHREGVSDLARLVDVAAPGFTAAASHAPPGEREAES